MHFGCGCQGRGFNPDFLPLFPFSWPESTTGQEGGGHGLGASGQVPGEGAGIPKRELSSCCYMVTRHQNEAGGGQSAFCCAAESAESASKESSELKVLKVLK